MGNYVWCTYRDWSFKMLEGIYDLEGWRASLIVTTPTCKYNFKRIEKKGIPILRINPEEALKKGGEAYERVKELQPSAIFHNGWSWYVPKEFLDIGINTTLHPGKLPKDRGGSPLQNQIRNGETWTYANIMELSEKLDEGNIYDREEISLDGYIEDVWARMTATGVVMTRKFLKNIAKGDCISYPQSNEEPTSYKRVRQKQGRIRLEEHTALEIYNMIRAHAETDPNTYVRNAYFVVGNKKLRITRASLELESLKKEIVINNRNEFPMEKIYKICDETNNNKTLLSLKDRFGKKVYLTRFYVSDL